jgi:peptidoglycan-N-acetylglucosamine deacetylase
VVLLVFAVAAAKASATAGAAAPLQLSSSTLTQSGQQLIWTVTTKQPFRPKSLAHDGLSLCLVLEQHGTHGQLCVAGPGPAGGPGRILDTPGSGPAFYVDATVTRSSLNELTAAFAAPAAGLAYRTLRWQAMSALATPPCSAGALCENEFPTAAAVLRLHVPKLVGCVPRGAPFVYDGATDRKQIALTFDDGPWYQTPEFLSLLERYHVPATFFEIGDQIAEYGDGGAIERRMLADGDMIGDHTWNHPNVSAGGAFARTEITRAAAAIKRATNGFEPCLFRAPYGAVSQRLISLARSLGFTTIQWDIDPRDWARPGVAAIEDNVLDHAHPGAIVEEHDGGGDRSETLAALPTEIRVLRSRGYQFVTVTQLLGMQPLYR